MNSELINFIKNSWFGIIIILFLLFPLFKFNIITDSEPKKRLPLILYPINLLNRFVFEISFPFTMRGAASLLIWAILFFDLFYNHTINSYTVTLVIVGLISLHLENLFKLGKKIKLFGLYWEKDTEQKSQLPTAPTNSEQKK